jgi:outer membrane protein assembly factor BamB
VALTKQFRVGGCALDFNSGTNNNNTGKVERLHSLQIIDDIYGIVNDVVAVLAGERDVYALDGVTGKKLWSSRLVNYAEGDIKGLR